MTTPAAVPTINLNPTDDGNALTREMHRLSKDAIEHTNREPVIVAAYMQAYATLRLANEVAELRQVLASGEAAITIAVEEGK